MQNFSDLIVLCIRMADSMAGKEKPQSAFLAICPSRNITFRDNRQKCRHQILALIHCTGRSELLKYLNDRTTTGSLCHLGQVIKRSQVEITFLVLPLSYCTHLNQSSQSFQKLWQKDVSMSQKCLCIIMGTKKIFTSLNFILHSMRKHGPVSFLSSFL